MNLVLTIAREGRGIIVSVTIIVVLFATGGWLANITFFKLMTVFSLMFLFFCGIFFRDPQRPILMEERFILAPADGKVVYVGDAVTTESDIKLKEKQVSIFLSILNVHTNWVPVSGVVTLVKYKKGNFLAAFKEKASEINEQTEIHIQTGQALIKVKQIAGILARRIICYLNEGDKVTQGSRLGYIRFGSRTDIIVPAETKINVSVGVKVKGGETVIGELI